MANSDLKISDLDEHAVMGAVPGGIKCGRLPEATIREDLPTILEKFNLLHEGKLNNASAVLFGRDFYYYPQCLPRLACFKGTTQYWYEVVISLLDIEVIFFSRAIILLFLC